jgi:hypothetical protein
MKMMTEAGFSVSLSSECHTAGARNRQILLPCLARIECDLGNSPLGSNRLFYRASPGLTLSGIGSTPYFHFRNCSPDV